MARISPNITEAMDTNSWMEVSPTQEHFIAVENVITEHEVDKYFTELGVEDTDLGKQKLGSDQKENVQEEAAEVFRGWLRQSGRKANLEAVKKGCSRCKYDTARTNLTKIWNEQGRDDKDKINSRDIYKIIEQVNSKNELIVLFYKGLRMEEHIVKMHMGIGADTFGKVMRLFGFWRQRHPKGTLQDLLKAFESVNPGAIETLSDEWRTPNLR